jgi:N6-adenosine-specific RNA methylase IME4
MTRYRTIVADPPWDHSDGTGTSLIDGRWIPSEGLPYSCMSLEEIRALPVTDMAERDAHLYLWTTNRYLREAYYVAEAWGFTPVKPLVWVKEPKGFFGAPFVSSAEFVLFCRRGVLTAQSSAGRQWWLWARGAHSAKPEGFMDIVEQVSPGPYLEMFSRRARLGWQTWGNEALHGTDMAAA